MSENLSLSDVCILGNGENISFPRIIEHAVGNTMANVVPALSAVLGFEHVHMNYDLYEMVSRAEFSARELSSKVSALAELFGGGDTVSQVRIASYDIEQFFSAFTNHLNVTVSDKIRGDITFVIDPKSVSGASFDARRVSMILYHLISNSLQHGRTDNKNIKLICKATEEEFELSVQDYGGGIPKEMQGKIFTKFRDDFSLENQRPGLLPPRILGIGLPLCRKLAEDMGGKLLFKNYYSGAKFTLIIPQNDRVMRENSIFYPEDALLLQCMSSLFLDFHDEIIKQKV